MRSCGPLPPSLSCPRIAPSPLPCLLPQVFVVRQGSPLEPHVLPYLVEDRSPSTQSYTDYMVSLHKAVLAK